MRQGVIVCDTLEEEEEEEEVDPKGKDQQKSLAEETCETCRENLQNRNHPTLAYTILYFCDCQVSHFSDLQTLGVNLIQPMAQQHPLSKGFGITFYYCRFNIKIIYLIYVNLFLLL